MSDLSINTIRDIILGHPYEERVEAVKLLGEVGGKEALKILIELIENEEEKDELRLEAVTAVEKIIVKSPNELNTTVESSLEIKYDSSIKGI